MIPVLHGVWAAAGGLVGDFEHIETQTIGAGGAASITFSSIPGTYKHLQIRMLSRTNRANTADALKITLNGSSSNVYAYHGLQGDGTSATSGNATTLTYMPSANMAGNSASSSVFGVCVTDILDYTSTTKNPVIRSLGGVDNNGSGFVNLFSGARYSTGSAITSVTLAPEAGSSFQQYSSFSLYGVK